MEIKTKLCILATLLTFCAHKTTQQQCVTNMDMIVAIDGSNSMGDTNFKKQQQSLVNLMTSLDIREDGIRVGLILFSSGVQASLNLTGDKQKVIREIQNFIYPDEETRTDLALTRAIQMYDDFGRKGSVPSLVLVVTDGVPTEPDRTVVAATEAKKKGMKIYAIGVTNKANEAELRRIASMKNQNEYQVFITEDFTTLEESLNNATYRACVDLKCQDAKIDIAFVLDSSYSVGSANFQNIKDFVHDFLLFADVDSGNIRVAAVTFSDTASVQFQLNTFKSKTLMNNAINNLQYRPGATNIAEALRLLRTNVFIRTNGDRSDVNNVVIVVSGNDVGVNSGLAGEEADATRAAGIQIFGIGIGHRSSSLLDQMVSRPLEEHRFLTSSFSQLLSLIPDVYNKFNKFCENPPPVPACYMGNTDLWFVVDVSQRAETLSRFQYTGDFSKLKNGLGKMMDIIRDPSVSNPDIRLGLVAYSDSSRILADVASFSSANLTADLIQQLPVGIRPDGTNLASALQNIISPPVVSTSLSYVVIVAPESSFSSSTAALKTQMTRLKDLGYTLAIFTVREGGSLDSQSLARDASGSRFLYQLPQYDTLEAATKNFTRDRLCHHLVDNSTGVCADSGHKERGVGLVAHPGDCDKYIQCYYDERTQTDLGVVRQCPMGLHWSWTNMTCTRPSLAGCQYDRCAEACEPYPMMGSCRAYWDCENGVSVPKCCPEGYSFNVGFGCLPDATCRDLCGPAKYCGPCQKKPNWQNQAGYDVMMLGGNMWMPRPCFFEDFNVVDCECSAVRNQACPADRVYDFSDPRTRQEVEVDTKEGIRVYEVQKNSEAILLGNRSSVHVLVNHEEGGSEDFTLFIRFREQAPFSPYGETLVSSGFSCGSSTSLLVSANDQFIFAEVRSSQGQLVEVKVPLKGLNPDQFKNLVLSYNKKVIALSVEDEETQYIAKAEAPSNICLACGLDFGQGLNKVSFSGELQKIAVYSCAWPLLY